MEAANELNLNPLPLLELFDLETPAVAVAIDAAGVALAAGGEDGMVAVWDIATGALSATYVLVVCAFVLKFLFCSCWVVAARTCGWVFRRKYNQHEVTGGCGTSRHQRHQGVGSVSALTANSSLLLH